MNVHARIRGVQLAAANGNPDQILASLTDAFATFKDKNDKRVHDLETSIDALNAQLAANRVGPGGFDGTSSETRKANAAMIEFLRTGRPDAMQALTPRAEMSSDSNPDGGYTVPKEIDSTIQNQLLEISPVRSVASIVTTGTSDYHKLINKRGASSGWAGERDPRDETDTPQLADIIPPMGELWAYPSLTQWMMDDSYFNLDQFIRDNVTDEFALQEGSAFINGDGIKKPRGFLTYDTAETADDSRPFGTLQFVKSGGASGFAASSPSDALIDLVHAVKPSYRAGPGVGWMMNSETIGTISKFKDGDGNYLWKQSVRDGQPSTLCGYPVYEAEDMPDVGANEFPIAFGNWRRGYLIVDRKGTTVLRDPYTKPGWVKFYISKRVGGALTDSKAIKLLKIAA